MPTRETAPDGAPCWVDLMTSDPDQARAFYGGLFGWHAEEPDEQFGGYFTFTLNGARVAGGMPRPPDMAAPDLWSVYLATADADRTVAAVPAHGGQVIAPVMAVGDLGRMAVVTDAGGAAVGVWQPGSHPGFGVLAEPGAPAWFELHTRDYAAAVTFYQEVFGWKTRVMGDTPQFRYTTLVEPDGDDDLAGIMDATGHLSEEAPPHWLVYFGAADTDQAVARVVELGGSVVMAGEDTPYGRLAVVTDPTGALFSLVGPGKDTPEQAEPAQG